MSLPTLVLDTFCGVYDLLVDLAQREFWDFASHEIVPGATYLIGRQQMVENTARIRELAAAGTCRIILSNPAEGSDTLRNHCNDIFHISDLVKQNKILLIGGGDMDDSWPCLQYDSFLPKLYDYDENIAASKQIDNIFNTTDKPYKFLFLNGRVRSHRQYLLNRFSQSGLLNTSIWSNLDQGNGSVQYLNPKYEVPRYRAGLNAITDVQFVKHHLFNRDWGEIYLTPEPYIDTYFSLVGETVFTYPYSFRTEKIWKPVFIGHPWICAASRGFYSDMHDLGFKTFGHVIDESFDQIDNNQDRIQRIAEVVEDLCQQDLDSFQKECYTVCKYNQQHLSELRLKVQREFPERFFKFLKQYE